MVPLARPLTTIVVVVLVAVTAAPDGVGVQVALYPVMVSPPVFDGAVTVNVICALPATAVAIAGAPGNAAAIVKV